MTPALANGYAAPTGTESRRKSAINFGRQSFNAFLRALRDALPLLRIIPWKAATLLDWIHPCPPRLFFRVSASQMLAIQGLCVFSHQGLWFA